MNRDEALNRLRKYMSYRGNSINTITMYEFYLNVLFDFTEKDDISLVSVDDCLNHILFLKKQGHHKNSTLNLMIASYRYLFEVILDRPLTKRQLPSLILEDKDPAIFHPDQIQLLLQSASLKLRTMILLGIDCGLRVSEVAKLKCSDIDSKNMLITIHDSKRKKTRTVKLSSLLLDTLRLYWKSYLPGKTYLFPSNRPCGYTNPSTINNSFRELLKICHLDSKGFRFHSLRHTFATMMISYECDPFLLKKLLGHKSFTSTARYIHMDLSDISESFNLSDKMSFSNE